MKKKLWKALSEGFQNQCDGHKWKINQWYKIECTDPYNVFDYSERIINILWYKIECTDPYYTNMEVLTQVEVRSKCLIGNNKQIWEEMRIVKAWRWKKEDSVALAIYAASLVLKYFEKKHPNDKRPREAIDASKAWLKNPSQKSRKTAEIAAWSAAKAALYEATGLAATEAAWAATEAAWSAAKARWLAAEAAWSAVEYARIATEEDKILNCCERWIRRRISKLEVLKGE